jgi:hypothetical protein
MNVEIDTTQKREGPRVMNITTHTKKKIRKNVVSNTLKTDKRD